MGLARLTGKPVTAFDVDPNERKICQGMAQANGVTVSLRKWCSPEALQALALGKRLLILSDVDGGEIQLFSPNVIRSLRHCDVVVELHGLSAEANRLFIDRWRGGTHEVNVLAHPPAEQNPEIYRLPIFGFRRCPDGSRIPPLSGVDYMPRDAVSTDPDLVSARHHHVLVVQIVNPDRYEDKLSRPVLSNGECKYQTQ